MKHTNFIQFKLDLHPAVTSLTGSRVYTGFPSKQSDHTRACVLRAGILLKMSTEMVVVSTLCGCRLGRFITQASSVIFLSVFYD